MNVTIVADDLASAKRRGKHDFSPAEHPADPKRKKGRPFGRPFHCLAEIRLSG
jgi:hypothetical protein